MKPAFISKLFTVGALSIIGTAAQATTLQEAVTTALENHPEVMIAHQNVNATEQTWRQSKAGYLPTVDLAIGSGHERSNNDTTRTRATRENNYGGHRSLWRNETTLNVNQMVFDGFATSSRVCRDGALHMAARHQRDEAKKEIALRTVSAFLDVLRAQEIVKASKTNLDAHKRYLNEIKKRSEGGRGTQADVRQAEGRLALARSSYLTAKGSLRNAEADYMEATGSKASKLKTVKSLKTNLPAKYEDALTGAMENADSIIIATDNIKAAEAAVKESKSAFFPRLDLDLQAVRARHLDGTTGDNNSYSALARINYNLYSGGADTARKRERTARVSEARDTLAREQRLTEEAVTIAWNDYKTAKERIAPLSQHVTSAEQTLKAYSSQFDLGQRSLLDLLDTEIEVFNARTAYINGKYAAKEASFVLVAESDDIVDAIGTQQ